MKIAIVVQGRFHAFDLGQALLERGHEVTIFTNYPRWAVARFGFPKSHVRSFWLHGIVSRLIGLGRSRFHTPSFEAILHRQFGAWARDHLKTQSWDVVHCWSGVSEELLREPLPGDPVIHLMRGSSHVQTQARLLREEEARSAVPQDIPSPWMIDRERREYALAPKIVVLATFAYRSFLDEGVPAGKLRLLPLGVSLESFRPPRAVLDARLMRIRGGKRLRVLFVGTLSFRKGLLDLAEVIACCAGDQFEFRLIGSLSPDAARLAEQVGKKAVIMSRVSQTELPREYAWGDVFVFPTIEDGYPLVLAQAAASALPIIVTTNCSGPDLVRENQTGWIVPTRSPETIVECLRWCESHRGELAAMVTRVYSDFQPRDWSDVAADYESICRSDFQALRR